MKMQTPQFQQALMQRVAYPAGITLEDKLDQGTYASFLDYLRQRGIPNHNIVKFKAGMVSMTLTMIEMHRMGMTGTGVDQYFSLRALNDRKMKKQFPDVYDELILNGILAISHLVIIPIGQIIILA